MSILYIVCIQAVVDREGVEKWDDALTIPDQSGVASALFFCLSAFQTWPELLQELGLWGRVILLNCN